MTTYQIQIKYEYVRRSRTSSCDALYLLTCVHIFWTDKHIVGYKEVIHIYVDRRLDFKVIYLFINHDKDLLRRPDVMHIMSGHVCLSGINMYILRQHLWSIYVSCFVYFMTSVISLKSPTKLYDIEYVLVHMLTCL